MTANSPHIASANVEAVGDLDGQGQGLSKHSPTQERSYLIALALITLLLAGVHPLLARSSHTGTSDFHAAIEMVGALIGLVAGFALIARFYALGNRFHLFIGLAFFVNAAEDFVHGLLPFASEHGWIGLPVSSLAQFIPGTYVTGRLLLGMILLFAPFMPGWLGKSTNSKRETIWVSLVVLLVTMATTALAFQIPLPRFIFPERIISRPVDFLSAIVLLVALAAFLREYHRERDMFTWWVALSIGAHIAGQVMMSFSKLLYDPFFDIAHVYKVLGYVIPLLGFFLYQIGAVTERRRAEAALQRRVIELKALNAMATIVNQSLDVDEILKRAMDEALRLVGVEAAGMLLLDEEVGELMLVAHHGLSEEFARAASRLKLGEGLAGRAAQTGKPVVIAHLAEYPGALKPFLEKERIESAASAPLLGSSGVIGAMSLGAASPHYFDAAGLELLTALGQQIAIGVEKARLYQETQQAAHDQAALNQVLRVASSTLQLEPLLEDVARAAAEALETTRSVVLLGGPEAERLRVAGGYDSRFPDQVMTGMEVTRETMPDLWEPLRSGQPRLIRDVASEVRDEALQATLERLGISSTLHVPILVRGEAIGVLALAESRAAHPFGERHICLAQTIADQIALAIENARLYAESRARATELEAAYQELREAQDRLVRQEKLAVLGQLASGVGHELRNPLGVMTNAIYVLDELLSDPESMVADYLGILRGEISTAGRIVEDLLDFARVKPPQRAAFPLDELAAAQLARAAPPDAITVEQHFPPALPPAFADRGQVGQVLLNLLTNAVQAMPEGGRLSVTGEQLSVDSEQLSVDSEQSSVNSDQLSVDRSLFTDDCLLLTVQDTGPGIPPENLEKIWEPLFTTRARGIGLGLAVSRRLVEANGGEIEVESRVGEGTTFTVRLPVFSEQ